MLQLGDAASVAGAVLISELLAGFDVSGPTAGRSLDRIVVCVVAALVAIHVKRLHRSSLSSVVTLEVVALWHVSIVVFGSALVVGEYGEDASLARALTAAVLALLFLIGWRSVFRGRLRAWRHDGRFVRPIMIAGISAESVKVHQLLSDHPDAGYRCIGVVGDRDAAFEHGLGAHWAGSMDHAVEAVRTGHSTGVVVVTSALGDVESNDLVRRVHDAGGHVHLANGIAGIDHRRLTVAPISHEPLVHLEPSSIPTTHQWIKRAIDVVLSAVGLVLVSPVLVVSAIAIKMHDRGAVLYRQERVGMHGNPFTIFKFRTMVEGAEAMVDDLADENEREGPLFKVEHDPRITWIGRLLRATDLDEIPQLFNVLRGEMSLVGPRPALASEFEQFDPHLQRRVEVRPGVTGLWQVEARRLSSFRAYRRLDLFYVDNWSLSLDLAILLLTLECKVVQVFLGRSSTTDATQPARPVSDPVRAPERVVDLSRQLAVPID